MNDGYIVREMSHWNVNTIAKFNASERASSLRHKRNEFKSAVRLSDEEELMKNRGIWTIFRTFRGRGWIRKPSLVNEKNKEVTKNHKILQIVAATIFRNFRSICWIRKCRLVSEKNKEIVAAPIFRIFCTICWVRKRPPILILAFSELPESTFIQVELFLKFLSIVIASPIAHGLLASCSLI